MVELIFASQGSTGCLTLELLTARLDKACENMLGGTIPHIISQHSWELQTERDWWSQSPPSHCPSVWLFALEGCLTQWANQQAHTLVHTDFPTQKAKTLIFKALLQQLDTRDLHALGNVSKAPNSTCIEVFKQFSVRRVLTSNWEGN